MSRIFKSSVYAATAFVTVFGIFEPIVAAAADPQGKGYLEEIIVTARRVEERLQDVPISMSVLSPRQLTDLNITSAEDLAKVTPSLSFNNLFGSDNVAFTLRGFSQDIGTAPTVGVFFADVVVPRSGLSGIEEHAGDGAGPGYFFDLQNVQVLKGPQGTLFGRNTTGGDVLLVPEKPKTDFEGYVEVSFGNYGLEELQAVINLPINDKIRLRAGVDQEKRDGYMQNISGVGPDNFDDINYVAGRLSLVIDVTDDIENYTIASFSRSDTNGPGEKIFACSPNFPGAALAPLIGGMACAQLARDQGRYTMESGLADAESYQRRWQIINNTTWDATDDLRIKNIISYSQFESRLANPVFADDFKFPSVLPPGFGSFPTGSFAGQHFFTFDTDSPPGLPSSNEESVTEELQVHGNSFGDKLDWQVGAYFEGAFPMGLQGTWVPSLVTCTNYFTLQCNDPLTDIFHIPLGIGNVQVEYGGVTYRDYALYGQATYTITDTLKFTGGVRWTDDITSANLHLYDVDFGVGGRPTPSLCTTAPLSSPVNNCLTNLHVSSRAPTWVMDLDWRPFDDTLTYVKYSRGYREGGINPNGPADPTIGTKYLVFQPEQVDTYEAGLKQRLHGIVPGYVNLAAFYNDFSNQQVAAVFPENNGALKDGAVNVGTSRIYGVEIDTTVKPFEDLTLNAAYTYLNSKIESLSPIQFPAGSSFTGRPSAAPGVVLSFTPHTKLSFTATYRLPVDETLGKLTVGSTLTYTGTQAINPLEGSLGYLKSYTLLNFNVNWEGVAGWPVDIEFFMTNALNEYYYTYISDFHDTLGYDAANIGEPRMFGGRLRYHF